MPVVLTGCLILFAAIPSIDPLRENIKAFSNYYGGFIITFTLFMLAVHAFSLLWSLGVKINPNRFIPVGVGGLFFYVGILSSHAKRNWFIGIRTPWTLSSERVWDKTHQVGAKLFKIAGVVSAIGAFFPAYAFVFVIVPMVFVLLYTTVYSYLMYRRQE